MHTLVIPETLPTTSINYDYFRQLFTYFYGNNGGVHVPFTIMTRFREIKRTTSTTEAARSN
jgi:hypothetical protein